MECFVCGKALESVDGGGTDTVYPYDGLAFDTHGHYGSGVFDPVTRPVVLKIVVCDPCVVQRRDRVYGSGAAELQAEYWTAGKLEARPEDIIRDMDAAGEKLF